MTTACGAKMGTFRTGCAVLEMHDSESLSHYDERKVVSEEPRACKQQFSPSVTATAMLCSQSLVLPTVGAVAS